MNFRDYQETDKTLLTKLWRQSFASTSSDCDFYRNKFQSKNLRMLDRDGVAMASLAEIPMEQYWGGRAVRAVGIAAVAVAPESRQEGVGFSLLRSHLISAAERKVAVSILYPSTWGFYRKLGYEVAGITAQYDIDLNALPKMSRSGKVRSAKPEDVLLLIHSMEEKNIGNISRKQDFSDWVKDGIWRWNYLILNAVAESFIFEGDDGACNGYAIVSYHKNQIWLLDYGAFNVEGFTALIRFLSGHKTTFKTTSVLGGASCLPFCVSEKAHRIIESYPWMLRVTNLEQAVCQRGFNKGVNAELVLNISDKIISQNNGRFILGVVDGVAHIKKVEKDVFDLPTISLSIQSFAALYAGFIPCEKLFSMGLINGNDEAQDISKLLFNGQNAWINALF